MPAKKRRPYNKSTGRKYTKGSYDHRNNNTPTARKNRNARMRNRRAVITALAKKMGSRAKAEAYMKGKEVDHKKALSKGGTNAKSNLKVISAKKNRAKDRPMGKRKKKK
jgi:uncharacterized membrane protein YkoI